MSDQLFAGLRDTHETEEKVRRESLALIAADLEMARRMVVVERAMALIFGYSVDYTGQTDDERTAQLLGIRLFNAAASGVKLALSGYYQTAFQQARDIMKTGFLLDYFRTSPEQIAVWRKSDRAARRKSFEPVKIRQALDRRDGDTEIKRAAEYSKLSELASHATYPGFALTTRASFAEFGPFVEAINLKAWLHEMVLRLGPSAVMYANQFPNADPDLIRAFQEFGPIWSSASKNDDG
jgi:hypothetical protein